MRKLSVRALALVSAVVIGMGAAGPVSAKDKGNKDGNANSSGPGNSGNAGNGGNNGNSGNGNPGNGNSGGGGLSAQSQGPSYTLGATACALSDIAAPGPATACTGFYQNNLNGGSGAQDNATIVALNALLGPGTYTTSFSFLEGLEFASGAGGTVNFAKTLYGDTVVSFHVGGANGAPGGVGYNGTAFYRFDAGATGLDSFTFNRPGLSNARLYFTGDVVDTAVPEPATWAMMILGFGGMGAILRRRRAIGFPA